MVADKAMIKIRLPSNLIHYRNVTYFIAEIIVCMLDIIKNSLIGYENTLSILALIFMLIALAVVAKHKYFHSKDSKMKHKLPWQFWCFFLVSNYLWLLGRWVANSSVG